MTVFFSSSSKAMGSEPPSGVLQILWEALRLPSKALPLFLPLLALTLSTFSLLFLSTFASFSPLITDLLAKLSSLIRDPKGPDLPRLLTDIQKDLRDFAGPGSLAVLTVFFASLFLMVAIVYTLSTAYVGDPLTPDALLRRVAGRWYQTLVTRLYIVLLTLGYVVLSWAIIGTAMLVSGGSGTKPASDLGMALAWLGCFLYMYLSTRWAMSLVVTVVEETWGIGALSMSVELFIGNRRRGTLLTSILMGVLAAIVGAAAYEMCKGPPKPVEEQRKTGLAAVIAATLWAAYAMSVYTVFYHECRKSHGLEEGGAGSVAGGGGGGGFMYAALPADTVVKVEAETA